MTDTITSADRKADLKTWIALQDELDNLEVERAAYLETRSENALESMISPVSSILVRSTHGNSFDELNELEDEEDCTRNRT